MEALESIFGRLASGFRLCFRLSDVRPDRAYAVLDGAALRRFYLETDPATLPDIEKAGFSSPCRKPAPASFWKRSFRPSSSRTSSGART